MLTNTSLAHSIAISNFEYETFRQQGIAWLEKLAGSEWTDFNAHDPGITILEQVCYALTDLSYRIYYDIPDLLAKEGEDEFDSLFSADRILTTHAMTLLDIRKLLIDIDGVNNAWIEPADEIKPPLYYLENAVFDAEGKAITLNAVEDASALNLNGLYRIFIEMTTYRTDISVDLIFREVAERLHDQRSLSVDYVSLNVLDPQAIQIHAGIEIEPAADPERVYLSVLKNLADLFSPAPTFYSLDECLAQGKTIAEIFDGPLLTHGFIDGAELSRLERKGVLYGSDLIRVIMDTEDVRLVEFAAFFDGIKLNDTVLELFENKAPMLDVNASKITLKKKQIPVLLPVSELSERFIADRRQPSESRPALSGPLSPAGRDRQVGNYYSILHQFPAVYGVGANGLSDSVGIRRKAQANQLKAYLLFFDQLLANYFAQLAQVRELFSYSYTGATRYAAAALDDPVTAGIWREPESARRQVQLQALFGVENSSPENAQTDDAWQARNRFLDHLLARFAEHFADYSQFGWADDAAKNVAANKSALLRQYDRIGGARGLGINLLAAPTADNFSGLEKLLSLKLGLTAAEKLYLIENLLLRPMPEDVSLGEFPFLKEAYSPDPFSSLLTVVLPYRPGRSEAGANDTFKLFAEQTVRAETPAHLRVKVCWLIPDAILSFGEAYQDWRQAMQNYRIATIGNLVAETQSPTIITLNTDSIPVRAARDRLIDLIGLGLTYPLRDVPVPDPLLVPYGGTTAIVVKSSQRGVSYTLIDESNNKTTLTGNGRDLAFENVLVKKNQQYVVQATKVASGLTVELLDTPTVRVGLNLELPVSFKDVGKFGPNDWIVDYSATVTVRIENTQPGVNYRLAALDSNNAPVFLDSAAVTGDGDTIELTSKKMTEDTDITVLAVNAVIDANDNQSQGYLKTVLSLKVKANPAIDFELDDSIIDHAGLTGLTLKNAQKGVNYQVVFRNIRDEEFVRVDTANPVITVPVPNKDTVRVIRPSAVDSDTSYASDGVVGTGADLHISFKPYVLADSYIGVVVQKTHTTKGGGGFSGLYLDKVTAILVRQDAHRALSLSAEIDAQTQRLLAPIRVGGGEPGVFYEFTTLPKNAGDKAAVQGLPVYFYEQDDTQQNKGIERLAIERDFVVAHTTNDGQSWNTLPDAQLSENVMLHADDDLSIRAIKAQTGVEAVFRSSVQSMLSKPSSSP